MVLLGRFRPLGLWMFFVVNWGVFGLLGFWMLFVVNCGCLDCLEFGCFGSFVNWGMLRLFGFWMLFVVSLGMFRNCCLLVFEFCDLVSVLLRLLRSVVQVVSGSTVVEIVI